MNPGRTVRWHPFDALRRFGDAHSVWFDWASPTFSGRLRASGLAGVLGSVLALSGVALLSTAAEGTHPPLGRAVLLGTLGIPLYCLGYWQAASALRFPTPRLAVWVFVFGGLAATLATAHFAASAVALQAGAAGSLELPLLLERLFAAALGVASLCFALAIAFGPSAYPTWAMLLNPALLWTGLHFLAGLDAAHTAEWQRLAPHAAHGFFFLATSMLLWRARPR